LADDRRAIDVAGLIRPRRAEWKRAAFIKEVSRPASSAHYLHELCRNGQTRPVPPNRACRSVGLPENARKIALLLVLRGCYAAVSH